jgi:hypothetical protein
MKKLTHLVLSVSVAALLTACGGGGDGETVFAADKYVGAWTMCTSTGATTSRKETLVFARGTAVDTLAFTNSTANHFAPACAGVFGTPELESGTVSFNGTKLIGFDTVDRVFVGNGGLGEKQVLVIRTTNPLTLFTGRTSFDGGTLDSDGYPTTLNADFFVRQ